MFKVASLVRFVKGWHTVNNYLGVLLRAIRLPIFFFIMLLVTFVQMVLVMKAFEYSETYFGYVNSAMGLTSTLLLHVGPVPIERHHASIYIVYFIFLMLGRVFLRGVTAQMAKEELRTIKITDRLHRLVEKCRDYELVPFVINRIRMYLGLKKQKKIRHHVRFEGMITPLSRGSSFASGFDELDDHFDDQKSEYTEIDDYLIDSESAMTKISDSSVWTTSKLIDENSSLNQKCGPIEPLHMDYIIMKLMSDSLPKLEKQINQLDQLMTDIEMIKEKERSDTSFKSVKIHKSKPKIPISTRAKSEPIIGQNKCSHSHRYIDF